LKNLSNSIILTNKYHIEFAHELSNIEYIEKFKSKMMSRIERFKNIKSNCISNKICFIRIELNNINTTWIYNIEKLISFLKKYISDFELILIINSDNIYEGYFPEFVKIYKYKNFSPDWKMDELDWNNIFK
jgi:hypothetical protein